MKSVRKRIQTNIIIFENVRHIVLKFITLVEIYSETGRTSDIPLYYNVLEG